MGKNTKNRSTTLGEQIVGDKDRPVSRKARTTWIEVLSQHRGEAKNLKDWAVSSGPKNFKC
jgi:hypothetical protein